MNGSGKQRYCSNWEKLSKGLRETYPCFFCVENDYKKKECHHLDGNKKNGQPSNAIVLCSKCHVKVHKGELVISEDFNGYSDYRVTVKITAYRY